MSLKNGKTIELGGGCSVFVEKGRLRAVRLAREAVSSLDHRKLKSLVRKLDHYEPDLTIGTSFQQLVWRELMAIPEGQTRTYGEVASAVGSPGAARAVGAACGANPFLLRVPCHRVVGVNGLGGFALGLPLKKRLLELEAASALERG